MFLLSSSVAALLAAFVSQNQILLPYNRPMTTSLHATTCTTTWLIDGNNLLGARGVPKDLDAIQKRLGSIRLRKGNAAIQVLLVMDGVKQTKNDEPLPESESTAKMTEPIRHVIGTCTRLSLPPGESTDDYIFETVATISGAASGTHTAILQVVTADRELRRRVRSIVPTCLKDVVNPVRFWKTYVPRLTGEKENGDAGRSVGRVSDKV